MITKSPAPIRHLQERATLPIVQLYFEINHLKQLYRQGWLSCGLHPEHCESVAEHTFGVVLLAMALADSVRPELDVQKIMRMALLHDMGEAVAGDVTPQDGVPRADKSQTERAAMERIVGKLDTGGRYLAIWDEYEAGTTPESRFVHQIDKLEMVLQAAVYEHEYGSDLSEIFDSGTEQLNEEWLAPVVEALATTRRSGQLSGQSQHQPTRAQST